MCDVLKNKVTTYNPLVSRAVECSFFSKWVSKEALYHVAQRKKPVLKGENQGWQRERGTDLSLSVPDSSEHSGF